MKKDNDNKKRAAKNKDAAKINKAVKESKNQSGDTSTEKNPRNKPKTKSTKQPARKSSTKKGANVPVKVKRTRINNPTTGRIQWVVSKEYNQEIKKLWEEKKTEEKLSGYLERDLKRKSYEKTSFNELSKKKRLRDKKGKYLSSEERKKVLEIAKQLDELKIDYSEPELIEKAKYGEKIVIESVSPDTGLKVPDMIFYWNAYNRLEREEFEEDTHINVIDFNGKMVYKGNDHAKALKYIYKFSDRIKKEEKKISGEVGAKVYPTVAVYDKEIPNPKRRGELLRLKVTFDYSQVKTNLPADYTAEFKKRLTNG